MQFRNVEVPEAGERISVEAGTLRVPAQPVVPFIEGDGTGRDIWPAAVQVFDAAIEHAYQGDRKIHWMEILAGEKARQTYGDLLPEETLEAIRHFSLAIKGPLTTPVSGGHRSLNVTLRQTLDLYACIRPVRYFEGVPSPVREPQKLDVVIFRENTEDVYAGLEWKMGSLQAAGLLEYLKSDLGVEVPTDSGIGLKPISASATKRLVRKAIQYAIDHRRESVTLVHKGNIMKFTEGAFRDWGYEVAKDEFAHQTISEEVVLRGQEPAGRIVVKDRLADAMFQQILIRPSQYDVLAMPNLNGDYFSDACAAQVGGLGMAPGANLGDVVGIFEATHGSAPKYAGQDKVNPSSLILSGVLMLEHMGWNEAADLIIQAVGRTIKNKTVTYDLARQMTGATLLKCSEFASAIIDNLKVTVDDS